MITIQSGIPATTDALDTPALLLDESRMIRNIARLREHLSKLGPRLRPHLKTSKCLLITHEPQPI
jgi:D-serine deaminase-like pyridoxal phosphate-dependent protein